MSPPLESGSAKGGSGPTGQQLIRELGRYDGSLGQFLAAMLATECRLGPAEAGAVLRRTDKASIDILATEPAAPEKDSPPPWLRRAAELLDESAGANQPVLAAWSQPHELYGQPSRQHILLFPLRLADVGSLTTAFLVNATDQRTLEAIRERLRLSFSLLGLSESRQGSQKKEMDLRRLRKAMDVLAAINRHRRFGSTVMALCNEMASQWQCERVSLGFLKGRYVQVKAISHTEDFSRKMQVVQDLEAAMEECLDQDSEIVYPASEDRTYISRATAELSRRHGPLAVTSFPIRQDESVQAVLTLERAADRPFITDEIEAIRLTLELCTTRLLAVREQDRWLGAKVSASLRRLFAALVGSTHTWTKVAAMLILAAVLFLVFARGQYKAEASFVLEGTERQVVPAPFDGYIKAVHVEVGDAITADQTSLAELDTVELRLRLAEAKAEKAGYLKQGAAAMRDGETAQAQIAQANADKAQAQIDLLTYMIGQATLISPLTGTLVEGDLKRQIGAPVKTGDVLFEVTPLDSLRAVLHVPEDQITDVSVGQEGYLATASYPAQRIRFVVEQVSPIAEVVKQENVFKVRAQLSEIPPWMRPGMEGVAKVHIGKRSYAWIWTRKIVNWIRMKLWL